jgi:hypothetical protein
MKRSALSLTLVLMVLSLTITAEARDAARDLRKMVGFTIIKAATVKEVVETRDNEKVVVLDDGTAFKVTFLLLDPLPLTDVIVFAKPLSKELREKFKQLPEYMLFEYRLLIDNEAFDATPVKLK